ncbi:uncharacterized protein I303_100269 [Kwoniella dejecticola CBS 10117]|uniref:Uncharacterized protein n=1 Tax=Kwoniella dejecticola CBS 10117 TaxID=1296121 RepID=A0A1A6AEK0_9TREE|nr:uncharacterized protein I303_00270 [Kwoniella dejecticola CBS 10117]OBR88453.1 hypothetical protein I303_00270 [Kwoniella dejecticola CBS 10117]
MPSSAHNDLAASIFHCSGLTPPDYNHCCFTTESCAKIICGQIGTAIGNTTVGNATIFDCYVRNITIANQCISAYDNDTHDETNGSCSSLRGDGCVNRTWSNIITSDSVSRLHGWQSTFVNNGKHQGVD